MVGCHINVAKRVTITNCKCENYIYIYFTRHAIFRADGICVGIIVKFNWTIPYVFVICFVEQTIYIKLRSLDLKTGLFV